MELKDYVIDLSKEYSIVTQLTSFVAIEKREEVRFFTVLWFVSFCLCFIFQILPSMNFSTSSFMYDFCVYFFRLCSNSKHFWYILINDSFYLYNLFDFTPFQLLKIGSVYYKFITSLSKASEEIIYITRTKCKHRSYFSKLFPSMITGKFSVTLHFML